MQSKIQLTTFKKIIVLLAFRIIGIAPVIHAETESIGNIDLIQTYLSDNEAFTQGFEMQKDKLIMGTGLYGQSSIGWLDLDKGEFQVVETLPDIFFGEGITFTPSHLWQLTWKENTAFKRDPQTFQVIEEIAYEGEGWGIAYDDERDVLWMSDGSDVITSHDSDTFDLLEEVKVTFEGAPIKYINELEFVNGSLYANLWQTNQIVKINLNNGAIEKVFDFTEIIETTEMSYDERFKLDVLNGIAHIEGQRFYITGKNYPVVYEVELIE